MKRLPIFYICSIVKGNLNFLQFLSAHEKTFANAGHPINVQGICIEGALYFS